MKYLGWLVLGALTYLSFRLQFLPVQGCSHYRTPEWEQWISPDGSECGSVIGGVPFLATPWHGIHRQTYFATHDLAVDYIHKFCKEAAKETSNDPQG